MFTVNRDIRDYLADQFTVAVGGVGDHDDLIEAEIIDSLGIFMLVSFIREHFGVEVEPEEVDIHNFRSLAAISRLVEAKLASA
ncbi:MAG: acyl carrier protein [Nitriliruptorales bacterium]|nr:acyl carrier protein [Nitriliruptorales bacterium]